MKFLIALCLVGVAVSTPRCRVANWQDWSECRASKLCSESNVQSHDVAGAYGKVDLGLMRMKRVMAEKEARYRHMVQCKAQGSCPELVMRQSDGPAECVDGQAGPIDGRTFPCCNIDLAYFVDLDDLSGGAAVGANDIWGWTDPENGDEYAIIGLNSGTSFVRITDPENPIVVAYLPTHTFSSLWRDVKVVNDHAFIVSEASDHGMQVYDLSLLRDSDGFQEVEATATFEEFGNAHNIVSNEDTDFVYAVGATQNYPGVTCSGGLLAVDVSDPVNPVFAGCYGDDGYTHDAQCIVYNGPDTEHVGQEICFGYNTDTLTIVDVTDKNNMFMLSRTTYDGVGYTHQGWITDDHTTVLLDDEFDETSTTITYLWDVSDLDAPVLENTYLSSVTAVDHNQYIRGDRAFQSNYMAGLRILNINQENFDLDEVAYFDVYPDADSLVFAGSWSNYAYLESAIIPTSSMEYGLFLLRPNESGIQQTLAQKAFGEQTRVTKVLDFCPVMKQTRRCAPNDC